MAPLIYIVLVLIVVGMGLWLINTYIPMSRGINRILNVVVVVSTAIWVLKAVGLWNQVVNYSPALSAGRHWNAHNRRCGAVPLARLPGN